MGILALAGIVLVGDGLLSIVLSHLNESYRNSKQFGRLLRIGIGGCLLVL